MTAPAPPRSPYEALSSVPTFAGLSEDTRRLLAEKARPLRVPRGTVLVRQGDASDELYIVVTGRFAVSVERREGIIAEIGPGEPIGELSFFGHSPRSATVTAARDSDVLILTRKTFSDLTPAAPEILTVILASVARRLSALTATAPMIRRKRPRLVAVLTIRPGGVAATDVAHALAGAIAPRQAEVFRPDSPAHETAGTVAERLAVLERNADLVICPVEPDGSGGLPEVLRHCDELLLLAHVGAGPPARPDPVEAAASALFAKEHRTVLLCRDRGAQPISGTSNWLRGREVGLHHHLALDQPSDFARLGRFVLGKALGLVLGGGAAYGCAHLGVAKALGEAGIPVDFLGGTSVGAAMAAALATGAHPDAVLDQTEEIFVRQRAMRRITVPVHALLDHHTLDASLRRHYGPVVIEDLPLNYFAVSASLTRNDMHVHRRGPVWEAIRASAAIPGVLAPFITREGDVLVDGAVVDNVPLNVMRGLKLGPNVVVSFTRPEAWRVGGRYADIPRRAALLRDLVLRRRRDYPNLVSVLLRSMFLASARLPRSGAPGDLFVIPDVPDGVALLDWHKGRDIAALAYRQMTELLESGPEAQAFMASLR